MNAFRRSLVLAVSMMVLSMIGFTGCGSSSSPNNDGGTGGSSGAVGGSTGGGGASSTGTGGHADAGSDVHTGAGGASGTDSGSTNFTCANLLTCCNSATPAQAQLKTLCLSEYNMVMSMGDSACSSVLAMIKTNGLCN